MEPAGSSPLPQQSGTSPFHKAVEYDEEIHLVLFEISFNSVLPFVPKYGKRSLAIIFSVSSFAYVRCYFSFVSCVLRVLHISSLIYRFLS
jgi:hypothetical protein